jgi:hypothetical protein
MNSWSIKIHVACSEEYLSACYVVADGRTMISRHRVLELHYTFLTMDEQIIAAGKVPLPDYQFPRLYMRLTLVGARVGAGK